MNELKSFLINLSHHGVDFDSPARRSEKQRVEFTKSLVARLELELNFLSDSSFAISRYNEIIILIIAA